MCIKTLTDAHSGSYSKWKIHCCWKGLSIFREKSLRVENEWVWVIFRIEVDGVTRNGDYHSFGNGEVTV